MITPSLRRAVLYHRTVPPIPQSHPTIPSAAAALPLPSHQRRLTSSKPPAPPNDGRPNVANPSVKNVASPASEDDVTEKRSGAVSRLSRRGSGRQSNKSSVKGRHQWTDGLPSVPSTQHLDPKDVLVASFFSNHRPMSIKSSVPLEAPEEVFDSIFTPAKAAPKLIYGPTEVIYTLASAVGGLEQSVAQGQNKEQSYTSLRIQERSGSLSALSHANQRRDSNAAEPHHLDGPPNPNMPIHVSPGMQKAILQIARQFRPFNPPPAPRPVSDDEIHAALAHLTSNPKTDARGEASSKSRRRIVISLSGQQPRGRSAHHFFTPYMSRIEEEMQNAQTTQEVHDPPRPEMQSDRSVGERAGSHQPNRIGRLRGGAQWKLPSLRRQKLHALSVKRQRRLKMKKHKMKKLMRRTRTLRRKLDK